MFVKGPTACVLVIGNEILSGRTADRNLNYIAQALNDHGIHLQEARFLPDDIPTIAHAVRSARKTYSLVLTTGGIGPTHDDVTVAAISHALDMPLEENASLVKLLQSSDPLNAAQRKMAHLPAGATLITHSEYPVFGGFFIQNIYVFAGIPQIMQAMLASVMPIFPQGPEIHSTTTTCFIEETRLAQNLEEIQNMFKDVGIGSYPFHENDQTGTCLVVRGPNLQEVQKATQALQNWIHTHGIRSESP